VGWFGRMSCAGRLPGWADWAKSQGRILLNLNWILRNWPRLWKFEQGDLGGILMWGFFLNSSRILKDFRKIQYIMLCNAS
jgi:hypothetical protein